MSAASRGGRGGGGSTSDFIRSTSAEVHWPKVPERGPYAAIDGICGAARHTARSPRSPHDVPNFAMINKPRERREASRLHVHVLMILRKHQLSKMLEAVCGRYRYAGEPAPPVVFPPSGTTRGHEGPSRTAPATAAFGRKDSCGRPRNNYSRDARQGRRDQGSVYQHRGDDASPQRRSAWPEAAQHEAIAPARLAADKR